jgi:hypothetical protein
MRTSSAIVLGALITLTMVYFVSSIDLAEIPAFKSIQYCMPNDIYVTRIYKAVLYINFVAPIFFVFFFPPTLVFSEVKHLFSSAIVFFVALLGLYIGVPVQHVDGAAVVFSNLYCDSTMGAIFVVLMLGVGYFWCILYFLYSCKCWYLLKCKGV